MAGYEEIEKVLTDFLEKVKSNPNKKAEVLALRGKWGVGKTYLYQDIVRKTFPMDIVRNSDSGTHIEPRYLSLFGLNSLDDVKRTLCFGNINESVMKSIGKDILTYYRGAGDATALALAMKYIKNTLICIDDIERKGKNLEMKDILGFVDMLKQQRNCHVVLIYNEEFLLKAEAEKDKKDFDEFFEKVIDLSPLLDPPVTESAQKIFQGVPDDIKAIVLNRLDKLKITNLRVMQKLHRHLGVIMPLIENSFYEAQHSIIGSLIFLTWLHECRADDVPTVEEVVNPDYSTIWIDTRFSSICYG